METTKLILSRMVNNNTFACGGLDPDLTKMPFEITNQKISEEEKVYQFIKTAIDITSNHVCTYKAQKAFFDLLPGGHEVLKEIISYVHKIHSDLSVIVDCKIGDIENTMEAYIKNIFGNLNADGVVVNPYMGNDAVVPLIELKEKAIVILAQTSNPAAAVIQNAKLQDGRSLWKHILDLITNRWNYNRNIIPVLSANSVENLSDIRSLIPDDMIILLAGIGAQEGNYDIFRKLLNSDSAGVFVNSSRGILYPLAKQGEDWRILIEKAILDFKGKLNKEREKDE